MPRASHAHDSTYRRGARRAYAGMARATVLTPVRSVPCPECEAPIGSPCITSTGKVNEVGHTSRRRMAARAAAEDPNAGALIRFTRRHRRETWPTLRIAHGWDTQAALAAHLGCNPATIANYEAGRTRPNGPLGNRYAAALLTLPEPTP